MLSNQEIITELKYIVECGVPDNVKIILLTLVGTLYMKDDGLMGVLAKNNQDFAKTLSAYLHSGYDREGL